MKFEQEKKLMARLHECRLSKTGWPIVSGHQVPVSLWPLLPRALKEALKKSPPFVKHGTPGKPFSKSPKCFTGDDNDL